MPRNFKSNGAGGRRNSRGTGSSRPSRRDDKPGGERPFRKSGGSRPGAGDRRGPRAEGSDRRSFGDAPKRPFRSSEGGDDKPFRKSSRPFGSSEGRPKRTSGAGRSTGSFGRRSEGDSFKPRTPRSGAGRTERGGSDGEDRPRRSAGSFGRRSEGDSFKSRTPRSGTGRPERSRGDGEDKPRRSTGSFGRRSEGDSFKPRTPRGGAGRPERSRGDGEDKPRRSAGSFGRRSEGDSFKPRTPRSGAGRPERSGGDGEDKPRRSSGSFGKRSEGDSFKPRTPRAESGRPEKSREDGEDKPKRSRLSKFEGDQESVRKPGRKFDSENDDGDEEAGIAGLPASENKPIKDKRPFEGRSFVESKIEKQRSRSGHQPSVVESTSNPDGLIRLNKYIANSGVCSRREADELIRMGTVSVNGVTITEMGYKVKATDDVRHDGKKLTAEKPVYILLNKPKGYITTTEDPEERRTVMEILAGAVKERIYPVGRLDRNTTGLLLFTNDGDLADKLTHPSYNAKKIYKAELDRPLTKDDFQKIVDGVRLEEGRAMVDDLAMVSDDRRTVGIELHIGWNRIVRRIFESLQYEVIKLDRVVYAGLDKKDLPRGKWRFLKQEEIRRLKHFN